MTRNTLAIWLAIAAIFLPIAGWGVDDPAHLILEIHEFMVNLALFTWACRTDTFWRTANCCFREVYYEQG